ncbi:hypothetical protein ABK046_47420, partial [Streptomyces caeruleatus]
VVPCVPPATSVADQEVEPAVDPRVDPAVVPVVAGKPVVVVGAWKQATMTTFKSRGALEEDFD